MQYFNKNRNLLSLRKYQDAGVVAACNSTKDCSGNPKDAINSLSKSEMKEEKRFDKEMARAIKLEEEAIARQKASEWAEYTNTKLDPYGNKYAKKDKTFADTYNKFLAANPNFINEQSVLGLSPEQIYAMIYKMSGRSGSADFAAPKRLRDYMKIPQLDASGKGTRFTDQQLYEAIQKMGGIDKYANWWQGGWNEIQKNGGVTRNPYSNQNKFMNQYQDGGNAQQNVMKQIVGFIQQAVQAGQAPEQIAQALISQRIPPEAIAQIFVQMGMPEEQAIAAIQAGAQGGGMAPQQGAAPEEEMMIEPQMRRGGGWNGTFSGNQGFAYGGVNPYMYNDPYTYMEMGGMIPYAQYGMQAGVPPRPQPEQYPDYATFKAEDDSWVMTYGDQAMDYTDAQWSADQMSMPSDLGYANPALAMVQANAASQNTAAPAPVTGTSTGTLVDFLNTVGKGAPSSFAARKIIANAVGIPNYTGTPEQDAVIITALKSQGAPDPFGTASPSMLRGLDPNTGMPITSGVSSSAAPSTGMASSAPAIGSTSSAAAPARFRTSKAAQKANATTQAALANIAAIADSTGSNAITNPSDSIPPVTDSIPIVPLNDSIPTVAEDSTTAAQRLIDSLSLVNNIIDPNDSITAAELDKRKNEGAAMTREEIAKRDKAAADAINDKWKYGTLAIVGTVGSSGGIYKAYQARKENIEAAKKAGILSADYKETASKQGEIVNELLKKYQDPKEVLRIAKERGFATTYDKAIMDASKDAKLKEEFKKIPLNITVDPFAQRTIDMAKEGWTGPDDLFTPETLKNLTTYLDDNMKQAKEIIAAAEDRGYRTPDDVKKLRELLGSDRMIIEMSGGLRTSGGPMISKFSTIAGIEGGTNQPKGTPQPDLGTYPEAKPGEPTEPGNIRKALTEAGKDLKNMTWQKFFELAMYGPKGKENAGLYKLWNGFDEFEGLKTKMNKLKVKLGNTAKNVVNKYNYVPGEGMEGTKAYFTFNETIGNVSKDQMNPKMQAVVDAFKSTTSKTPKSTSEIIAQYHADLDAGLRTPLVEAVEAGTGITSTKQRTNRLGNTFDGLKKKMRNVNMYPGTAGNISTPFRSVNALTPTSQDIAPSQIEAGVNAEMAKRTSPKSGRGKASIRKVTNKAKVTQQVINDVLNNGVSYPEPTPRVKVPVETKPLEILEPIETPSAVESIKGLFRKGLKLGKRGKLEYGGAMMEDDGSYIPNYAMAYGGDMPEAMYGMGMAYGGMYASGGEPCYDREGNPIPCPPMNAQYPQNPYHEKDHFYNRDLQYPIRMNPSKQRIPNNNNYTNFPHEYEHSLDNRYNQRTYDPGFTITPSVRPGYNPDPNFTISPAPSNYKKRSATNNGMLQPLGNFAGGGEVVPCNTAGVVKTPQGCFCPEGTGYDRSQSACIAMKEYQASQTAQTEKECEIYGQTFNPATNQCECGPGKEVDPVKKICVTAGSLDKLRTPMTMDDIYSGRGNKGKGLWNAGLEVGKNDWNLGSTFSLNKNANGRLGSPTFGLYGNSSSLFGGRGGLNGALNYQSGNTFGGNLGASIPLSKKNPYSQLSVFGAYDQNLNPNAASADNMQDEDQNFMRTNSGAGASRQNFSGGIGYNTVTPSGLKIKAGVTYNPNRAYGGAAYAKGGININPANKGKFTKSANAARMGTQEFAQHVLSNKDRYGATQVKRANFAKNAAGWNHQQGGIVAGQEMDVTPEQLQMLQQGGYQFEIMR